MSSNTLPQHERTVSIGIDVGGTFTDVVCVDSAGSVNLAKIPTTRGDPSRAVAQAIDMMFEKWDVRAASIERFAHGTTAGTNAVLERKGARIGLITTEGFKDVLEIGRQMRHRMYDMILLPETPGFLAEGQYRFEVPERVSATGEVIIPLDEAAVVDAVDQLAELGVQAIAVCLLFSFINAEHEERIRQIIQERHPTIMVSLSCEVDPAFREYERTVVTAFDAYVKPVLGRYMRNMEEDLVAHGIGAPLQIMLSRGGISASQIARQRPVRLFLSGPAAGVIGARMVGQEVGIDNLITVDIGGTSCDISVISDSKPLVRNEGVIDGFPVRVPMVDVSAIGSGGGSIAWLDGSGGLRVGPESAGSEPGPACYGRGGVRPTVTDASVVLGYIDPDTFAGGAFKLKAELSYNAIHEKIAGPMGISVEAAALGIHQVVNAQMAEGIRLTSIRRGFDPRKFSLMPMGGGGPLHATALAGELGIDSVVVPRNPGVLCAYGLLAAPIEHEMATAFPREMNHVSLDEVGSVLAGLDAKLDALMAQEKVNPAAVTRQYSADVCYVGQSYHLEVPFTYASDDTTILDQIYQDFLVLHDAVYGHSTQSPAKIVNLRSVHHVESKPIPPRKSDAVQIRPPRTRAIRVTGSPEPVMARVIERSEFTDAMTLAGPAIIEQVDTTILVEPGWIATLAPNSNLIINLIK